MRKSYFPCLSFYYFTFSHSISNSLPWSSYLFLLLSLSIPSWSQSQYSFLFFLSVYTLPLVPFSLSLHSLFISMEQLFRLTQLDYWRFSPKSKKAFKKNVYGLRVPPFIAPRNVLVLPPCSSSSDPSYLLEEQILAPYLAVEWECSRRGNASLEPDWHGSAEEGTKGQDWHNVTFSLPPGHSYICPSISYPPLSYLLSLCLFISSQTFNTDSVGRLVGECVSAEHSVSADRGRRAETEQKSAHVTV